MHRIQTRLSAGLDRLSQVCTVLICIGITVMALLNGVNITWRGLFGTDVGAVIPWTVVIFVWTVFLGFFPLTHLGHDVVLEYFRTRMPEGVVRVLDVLVDLLIIAVCAVILWQAPRAISMQVGPIPMVGFDRYWMSIPLFLSCALILVDKANNLTARRHPEV
ncbi:TRAP transporter small permease subunit [Yangia mangrovi]|uniref:TRAP transporter small permease protein n=2 Tax=Roseobacteraceae TaxID=2854170 RepID=A0A2A3K0G9_9RHOB|nr:MULTISPECIES: TRAP transporter small permease subunit [Roseobacteraceae]MBE9639801.1 TRAP transporter small permease subunit [Salipiger mangrovisoli]MCT4370784.1 TRAP transporter small permease subunit [Alloyangia mangrovi]